jgi:tetratricopeptide (TPR) repeat protein
MSTNDIDLGSTQPTQPKTNKPRRRFPWQNILIFIVVIALGGFASYRSAIGDRISAQSTQVSQQLKEQFDLAVQDIEAGRYEAAQQRLEFILQRNPNYPGATEKLTQVILISSITPIPTATALPPTPDTRGAEGLFVQAQQLMAAQDWNNVILTLDQLRKEDPNFRTAEVDGMYYVALRNFGVDKISKLGELESGMYYMALAERFGPLDSYADGLRSGARLYTTGASFWEVDWPQAVNYFAQAAGGWPSLWDSSSRMTAAERYKIALSRYGDLLYEDDKACQAYEQYQIAMTYGELDETAAKNSRRAFNICYPPTEVPEIIIDETPEPSEEAPTEMPTE